METLPWLESIYFKRIEFEYRAVSPGFLSETPGRKLRFLLKSILQGISPCLNQIDMDCRTCESKHECIYFRIIEEQHEDYHPYWIAAGEGKQWRGAVVPGTRHGFSLCIAGEAVKRCKEIEEILRHKRWITLSGVEKRPICFELLTSEKPTTKTLRLEDLLKKYRKYSPPIRQIGLELLTSFSPTFRNKTVIRKEEFTFELFLDSLHKRTRGLARCHCGYSQEIPESHPWFAQASDVKPEMDRGFVFVPRRATKNSSRGKSVEYVGGFVGKVWFKGDLTCFFPMIVMGEALQIGKDTTQGLGQYRIREINGCVISPEKTKCYEGVIR